MLHFQQASNAFQHFQVRPRTDTDVLFPKTNLNTVLRRLFPWALVGVYSAICVLRAPHAFAGRFWAEEGIYYGLFQTQSVISSLFYAGAGYPLFLTNASVLGAELFPVEYAPVITTLVGLAALLTLLTLILRWGERLGLKKAVAGIIAALLIMLPHTAEVHRQRHKFAMDCSRRLCAGPVIARGWLKTAFVLYSFYRWTCRPSAYPADTSFRPQMCFRPVAVELGATWVSSRAGSRNDDRHSGSKPKFNKVLSL
jgi:hypothetical protein